MRVGVWGPWVVGWVLWLLQVVEGLGLWGAVWVAWVLAQAWRVLPLQRPRLALGLRVKVGRVMVRAASLQARVRLAWALLRVLARPLLAGVRQVPLPRLAPAMHTS